MATVWDNASWQQQELTHLLQRFITAVESEIRSNKLDQSLLLNLNEQIKRILERLNTDFSLMVMGDFKRGKSTLVNALLEQTLVPTNVAPETVTVNRIQYGPEVTAVAHLQDETEMPISIDDLAIDRIVPRLLNNAEEEVSSSLANADRTLIRDLLNEAFDKEELANLCFDLQIRYDNLRGESYSAKVRELIVFTERHGRFRQLVKECFEQRRQKFEELLRKRPPIFRQLPELEKLYNKVKHIVISTPTPFLQGIRLIDTPGMSDLVSMFDNQVHQYLLKADVIIYVLSIRYPLSQAERDFLQRAISPHDFSKLFFVINRIDEESPATVKRFTKLVEEQIHHLFPEAYVFGISALDEMYRATKEERPTPKRQEELETAFQSFRQSLHRSVIMNRDVIQLDRAVADMEEVLSDFDAHLARIQHASSANQQELDLALKRYSNSDSPVHQKFKIYQEKFDAKFNHLSDEAAQWLEVFIDRLETETIPSLEEVTPRKIRRHFHIFLADSISQALHTCLNAQRPLILNLVNDIRSHIRESIRQSSESPSSNSSQTAWQNLDIFDDLAQQSISDIYAFTNELLRTVADYIENNQSIVQSEQVTIYQEQLRDALPNLRDATVSEVQTFYNYLKSKLSQQIAAIYQDEVNAAVSALRQAQFVQKDQQSTETAVITSLKNLRGITKQTRQNLQSFQQQLWIEV